MLPDTLPQHGKDIWEEVYNAARGRGATEESAAKQAWGVVKRYYRKKGDRWIARKPPKQRIAARGRVITIRS